MKFKLRVCWTIFLLMLFSPCFSQSMKASDSLKGINPTSGFVPDAQTAVAVAHAVLSPIYGKEQIMEQAPLVAQLAGETWVVSGTLPKDASLGGVVEIRISKRTGKILRVLHTK